MLEAQNFKIQYMRLFGFASFAVKSFDSSFLLNCVKMPLGHKMLESHSKNNFAWVYLPMWQLNHDLYSDE